MITDINDKQINYIPAMLREGQQSKPQVIKVTPVNSEARLFAEEDTDVRILGKIGGGAYQDLSSSPLNLAPYFGSFVLVTIKAKAAENIAGLVRKSIFVGTVSGGAADWVG